MHRSGFGRDRKITFEIAVEEMAHEKCRADYLGCLAARFERSRCSETEYS